MEKHIINEKLKKLDKMNVFSKEIANRVDGSKQIVQTQEHNHKMRSITSEKIKVIDNPLLRPTTSNNMFDIGYFEQNNEIPLMNKVSNTEKLNLQARPTTSSFAFQRKKMDKAEQSSVDESQTNLDKRIFKKFYIDKYIDPNFKIRRNTNENKTIKVYHNNAGILPAYELTPNLLNKTDNTFYEKHNRSRSKIPFNDKM